MTPFTLPPLPYAYNALEPYMSEQTLQFHHDKHHQAYIDKLNGIIAAHPELAGRSLEDLLTHLDTFQEPLKTDLTNQGGGVYNHDFFWKILSPTSSKEPVGNLKAAIDQKYGSFDNFKTEFNAYATKNFGSGWTFLVKDAAGNLEILNTPNQVTPISQNLTPILALDIWEHAYYLQYQNRRPEFINNFWPIVNWDYAEELYNGK